MFKKSRIGLLVVTLLLSVSVLAAVSCGAPEIEGVAFENVVETYDGTEKTIEVTGVPEGATVTYNTPNTYKDAGAYTVTATVTQEGFADKEISAVLTILPKAIRIDYENLAFKASGSAPTNVKYTLTGVVEGDTVDIEFDFGGCDFSEEGEEGVVTAICKNDNYTIKSTFASKEFVVGPNEHTVSFVVGIDGQTIKDQVVGDGGKVSEPRKFVNLGYDFDGWYNGDVKWDFTKDRVSDDMTLVAKWLPTEYKINYFLNGGTNSEKNPATYNVVNGAVLHVPEKEGAMFLGWYSDRELTVPMNEIKPGSYNKTLNIYAKWTSENYDEIISDENSFVRESSVVNGPFRYTFAANIDSFGENGVIYIGKGKNTVDGCYLEINSKNLILHTNGLNNEITSDTRNHGRNMAGYVIVDIEVSYGSAAVTLTTNDGQYTCSFVFEGKRGEIFAASENCTLNNASFAWSTNVYEQPVWIIGDETVGSNSNKSWAHQIIGAKFTNVLLMGANGVDSTLALAEFKNALVKGTPTYAVWAFGAESGAAYDANLAEFISVCKTNRVIPVLTTQLLAFNADNAAKNAAVVASGEKYIDFASLESDEGILLDGEYTENGAKTLFAKLLVDFPEFITPETPVRTETASKLDATNSKLLLDGGRNNRVRDGKHLVFTANVESLAAGAKISVGHGTEASLYTNWIEITSDSLKIYSIGGVRPETVTAKNDSKHGLTIKDYITVIISADKDKQNGVITIVTNGGVYKKTYSNWSASNGSVFASVDGVELTNAKMHWTCVDYSKDIWLIGASYFTLGDPARWLYYLYSEDFDANVYVAGRGGMDGPGGIDELKDALKSGHTPKAIAWGVGMNDGSDPGDIKPAYYNALLELMQICKENDIMLYIMTIPQTPKADNTYKLDYVINRKGDFANYDYRVVDIARSINAHELGSSWYEGMIHSDQTHPTNLGARAFYMQFLCDFPELMLGGSAKRVEKTAESLMSGSVATITTNGAYTYESAITLSADYGSSFNGKVIVGNGRGVEGGTYVSIEKDFIRVYTIENGEEVLVKEVASAVTMKDILNFRIYVECNTASIALMSAGDSMATNNIFSFDCYWNSVGDVFVTSDGVNLTNVNMKWVTIGG